MPYLGIQDGEEVIPLQVTDDSTVRCPDCGEEMHVNPSHYRDGSFVSRHFSHPPDNLTGSKGGAIDGGGGECVSESEIHHKMKTISYARLEEYFPNADLELEGHLNGRFADVLLTFPEPRSPYGKGIAVEVQYRNKGKDTEAVTEHYFEHSYSVAWLEEEDFIAHDVDLSGILTLWPNALPDRRGMVGYSDVIQSLWKESNPPVEREIPIPREYWASFNQSDDWILISEERLKHRAELQLLKYSTDSIIFGLAKGTRSGMEEVKVEASKQDVAKIRRFADQLDDVAFGDNRPPAEECDPEWHDLAQVWLTGSPTVKTWMKATLPNPDSSVVLQLWKKNNYNTKHVGIQINYSAVDRLHDIADTLERAFEIENGERELFISDDSSGDPGNGHN